MNVYIFMGTHLPEMENCLTFLTGDLEVDRQPTIHYPEGLNWSTSPDGFALQRYLTDQTHWVWNPDAEESAFVVLDPRMPLIPQLENLAGDLRKCLIEPVKVVTCVDTHAAEIHQPLRHWYDACIYYSDLVLLGNRAEASKAFVRDFQKGYERRRCYPCLFLMLKGRGRPDRPYEVLDPDTRRLSQLFDLPKDEPDLPTLVIEASCDLDMEESESDPFREPADDSDQHRVTLPDVADWIVKNPDTQPWT